LKRYVSNNLSLTVSCRFVVVIKSPAYFGLYEFLPKQHLCKGCLEHRCYVSLLTNGHRYI